MTENKTIVKYDYTPHAGPQAFAHGIHVDEILYGGAAGGGKADGRVQRLF